MTHLLLSKVKWEVPLGVGHAIPSWWSYTVHSPLFYGKIVEIERFALRAAILHECQNYFEGGGWGGGGGERGGLGGSEKNREIFLAPLPLEPGRAMMPDARALGTFENQDGRH